MLDDLRKKQKWIIWAIAIIFIGGMGLMGISRTLFSPVPHVGTIYGKKITTQEFDRLYRQNIDNHRMNNPDSNIDEQTLKNINEQTWNQLVSRTVMEKQFKRYRIKVSNNDVIERFRKEPPQELVSNPNFMTDGVFDNTKYLNAVRESPEFGMMIENYYRQILPYEKLEAKIKNQIVVTVDSVRADYIEKNDKVSGRVIYFDWNKIAEQEVTESEMREYYTKNKEQYKKEDARKYSYVHFPLVASFADSVNAAEEVTDLYQQIVRGGDFGALAKLYSQDPGSAANNGSLGFFGRGRMVPEFENTAFGMEIGEISEPVKSNFGWHIIQVTGKRNNEQGEPEVEASHILIKVEPSDNTKYELRLQAERFANSITKNNLLPQVAADYSLEVRETPELFSTTENISGIGRFPHLVKEAFSNKLGFVPPVVNAPDGSFYVLVLTYRKAAHIEEFDLVSEAVKREVDKDKRMVLVREKAKELMSNFEPEQWFDQATEEGFIISDFTDILITRTIPRLAGLDKDLNNELFKQDSEQWTGLISTEKGNYLAYISTRTKPDMENFEKELDTLTNKYRQTKETTHYNEWYQKVLKEAKAVDMRYVYYN